MTSNLKTKFVSALLLGSTLAIGSFALADTTPTAEELSMAVSDHTYQGSMSKPGSTFTEYYAPDGSIVADGYSGKWRTEQGKMCFQYGDGDERCFEVTLNGPSMVMLKEGAIDGNGMLIDGNPNELK